MIAMWKYVGIGILSIVVASAAATGRFAYAAEVGVTLREITKDGVGKEIGQVQLKDSAYGLLIKPDLRGLLPGPHGLHVHENPDCGPTIKDGKAVPGGAAGGHYDPEKTERSEGPYGQGALGELPNLMAEQDGTVTIPTLAPRLEVKAVRGRSLVIHAGAERYGQGHASHHGHAARRVACGVIE